MTKYTVAIVTRYDVEADTPNEAQIKAMRLDQDDDHCKRCAKSQYLVAEHGESNDEPDALSFIFDR